MADKPFQALLFGSDAEALAEEEGRKVQHDQMKSQEAARRAAWQKGQPGLDDGARYFAAHYSYPSPLLPFPELHVFGEHWTYAWEWAFPEMAALMQANRNRWHTGYEEARPWVILMEARRRAEQMGCRIGKTRRIRKIYELADSETPLPCYWCKRLTERFEKQVDHKVPLIRRGAHAAGNLCVSCWQFNLAKGDRLPEDFLLTVKSARERNTEILRRIGGTQGKSGEFWDAFFGK
jgi:hypothetical protein